MLSENRISPCCTPAWLTRSLVRAESNEAVTAMERAMEYGGPFVVFLGIIGGFYALQGSIEKAHDALRNSKTTPLEGHIELLDGRRPGRTR